MRRTDSDSEFIQEIQEKRPGGRGEKSGTGGFRETKKIRQF